MKKHLIAAAALATLSSAAFAQSATVYGIFDLSVSRTSNADATLGASTELTDAVWMPSVFGITGTEDLGGGMKAAFNLESDVNVDTGALSGASGGKLFGRKANVALSGSFGELKLGKDIDQIFLQGFIDNVRNSHSASAFISHTVAAAATTLDTDSVFTDNMVRYTTPTFNGLKASLQYAFGEQAGQQSKNSSTSLLVNYSNSGLSISVGTKTAKDVLGDHDGNPSTANAVYPGNDTKLTYIGATYQMGPWRFATAHFETKPDGSIAGTKYKTQEYGVGYAVSPKLTAAVNFVTEEKGNGGVDNEGDITSASLKYSMSKRTSLWALVSRTDNNGGYGVFGANYSNGVAAGKDGTSTALGITHTF